jgi:hypothetical protein
MYDPRYENEFEEFREPGQYFDYLETKMIVIGYITPKREDYRTVATHMVVEYKDNNGVIQRKDFDIHHLRILKTTNPPRPLNALELRQHANRGKS